MSHYIVRPYELCFPRISRAQQSRLLHVIRRLLHVICRMLHVICPWLNFHWQSETYTSRKRNQHDNRKYLHSLNFFWNWHCVCWKLVRSGFIVHLPSVRVIIMEYEASSASNGVSAVTFWKVTNGSTIWYFI